MRNIFLLLVSFIYIFSFSDGFTCDDLEESQSLLDSRQSYVNYSSSDQVPVYQWLDENVFGNGQHSGKCFKYSMFGIELFSGVSRGAVFLKLGYDFGSRISSSVGEPGTIIVGSIFGVGVFVPMAVLGTNLTSNNLKKLITKKSEIEKNIETERTKLQYFGKYALEVPIILAGIFSAPPMTYLTYEKLHKLISWGWVVPAVPTFYVRTLIDYYAITTLGKMLYNEIKFPLDTRFSASNPHTHRGIMANVRNQLLSARSFIASLNESQTEKLIDVISKETIAHKKFQLLSNPELVIEDTIIIKKDSWGKKIAGYVGGLIGGYGMWIYLPVAKKSFAPILSLLRIEENQIALEGLAVASTITASSLTALATWSSTHKFYDAISTIGTSAYNRISSRWSAQEVKQDEEINLDLPQKVTIENKLKWKRAGAAILSIIFASFNAAMQGEVALEFLDMSKPSSKINLLAGIIASFSTCFWAVDEALLSYLKASDPRTPLLKQLDIVIEKLPNMSLESLKKISSQNHADGIN